MKESLMIIIYNRKNLNYLIFEISKKFVICNVLKKNLSIKHNKNHK